MKKLLLISFFLAALMPAFAQEGGAAAAPATAAKEAVTNDKILYSLGYLLGDNIKEQLILDGEDDFKAISQGLRDSLLGRNSQTDLVTYKPLIENRYREDMQKKIAARKIEQNKYLENLLKDKKKYRQLPNKAVVQTIKEGKGPSPKETSMVKVHYEGTLLNGTVFDSSVKRGVPAEFPLNGVIPCWTQGVQTMKKGGKAKLFCPPETAYGDRQAGGIPPGSLLVFDVELLDITD